MQTFTIPKTECRKATVKLERSWTAMIRSGLRYDRRRFSKVVAPKAKATRSRNYSSNHTQTHTPPLPTLFHALFFSISKGDSWVYYKAKGTNGKVVAKLRIPAGFSVVATTEIHSGLVAFNPEGLEHWSETTQDRVMFRIVHGAPVGGLHMACEDTEWTQFLGESLSAIFPAK